MSRINDSFSFKKDDPKDYIFPNHNIIIRIAKFTNSIASLSILNLNRTQISVPNEFQIIDKSDNSVVRYANNTYYLAWSDCYTIKFRNELILNLDNQRLWSIKDY